METPDLILRVPVAADAAATYELLNDPDVRRWNPARECPDLETAAVRRRTWDFTLPLTLHNDHYRRSEASFGLDRCRRPRPPTQPGFGGALHERHEAETFVEHSRPWIVVLDRELER
jgi:hypothetical protein